MLRLVGSLNLNTYSPRNYVIAKTDKISEQKVKTFEKLNSQSLSVSTLSLNNILKVQILINCNFQRPSLLFIANVILLEILLK